MGHVESVLMARAVSREPDALEVLYDTHARMIYNQAMAILASEADAEDVLGEVMVKMARRRGPPILGMKAFLLTATRHEAYSMLRRRARETPLEDSEIAQSASLPDPSTARSLDTRLVVREALDQLPPEQREVVTLKLFEEMTFEEIGRVVRAPANTVASRYRYALQKLRQALGDDANE